MVQLPPECADNGVATINRLHEPFYCMPWRGMHYFGPTETVYEGDLDDIHDRRRDRGLSMRPITSCRGST